jgi:PAS domain S-box-containing protein
MSEPCHILVIEDCEADFKLIEHHLKTHGLAASCHQVASRAELNAALDTGSWDVVLSDYLVPQLNFEDSLRVLQARLPEAPVILVSGAIGEERAIELLKSGVWGFVLKDNLTRLASQIERSLRESAEIRERKRAEAEMKRQGGELVRLNAELTRSNRATLNLMQNAIAARALQEQANAALRQEITVRKQAELAQQESARQLQRVIDSMDDGITVSDPAGHFEIFNPAMREITGYAMEEANGTRDFAGLIYPDSKEHQEVFDELKEIVTGGGIHRVETVMRAKDGSRKVLFVSTSLFNFKNQGMFLSVYRDITARKQAEEALRRLNRELRASSKCNRILMRAVDEPTLLNDICRVICDEAGYRLAWVGYAENDEAKTVRPVAWGGFDDGYVAHANLSWADGAERAQGPGGAAIRSGKTVYIQDFTTDPRMSPWRESALQHGYRSAIALPLKGENASVFGFLLIYSTGINAFTPDEIRLLEDMAGDLAFGITVLRGRIGRKQAEEAMIASEVRYRRLFDASKDGILILNAKTGRIVDVNPFLIELLGYSRETFFGKHLWELGFFKDIAANEANFQELQAKDYIRYDNLALETSGGRRIDVEFVSNAYLVDGFRVMQCNIRDITGRKRAEEAHARLATAVEQAAEAIVITDLQGTIQYVNPAFEKISGYARAEALGQNPRILKSGKQDAEFYRQMWAVLGRGETWKGHFTNQRKDGMLYEEEATISPIRDTQGAVINFVAIKRDVTHEVQLEAQFRQSQKLEAVGTLAGGVAHDFNNILQILSMEAGLLKGSGGLSPAQVKYADQINATVDRAAALTRQLLLFSRKEILQPRDLDLSLAIANLTKMLRRTLGENIEVQLKLAAQPLFVHADPAMLDQVLMNLAVNARDAMPQGGQLAITTAGVEFDEFAAAQSPSARPGSFVCLSVADTGSGIPPEVLPKIFEPFFTTKGVGKGTGLGLATVFGIVQQHHGWLSVYTEAGQGTTFKVYLPRLVGMSNQIIAQKMLAPVPTGKETILLVEDESALRAYMSLTLASLGYRVLEAPTGVQALEVWQEHGGKIRLLLTDLMLPEGMTGNELAQHLLRENPKLKVVYMSGYSTEIVGKDLSLVEGVNFLAKPFVLSKLAQTIRKCLDQH